MSVPKTKSRSQPRHDHVARLVDRHFDVNESELIIGGVLVSELVAKFGTPLFIYDESVIVKRIQKVKAFLPPKFELYYSIKANPNAAILKLFLQHGCGLEIASGGELFQALDAGCPPQRLIFAGPGKSKPELAAALKASINEIHVESIDEARWLDELAKSTGQIANIGLRINPVSGSGGAMRMGGQASPFGIDEESLEQVLDEILTLSNVKIAGVHLFMGTQILDADVLLGQYQRALTIARSVAARLPHPLETIDFGGGLGTPYFAHESELDLEKAAAGIALIADEMSNDPLLTNATGVLEPGRFLVNESGLYVATISRIKQSRGKTFAVIDGGMHHHLGASGNLGQTIKRNYPVAILNKLDVPATEQVEIVGPLCTPLDTLARRIKLPPIE